MVDRGVQLGGKVSLQAEFDGIGIAGLTIVEKDIFMKLKLNGISIQPFPAAG